MPSQLEILRESLAKLEAQGHNGPLVQGLRAQIAAAERTEWRRANGGWWGPAAQWLQMPVSPGD